jgi:Cu-Zn family superoxide dismutase
MQSALPIMKIQTVLSIAVPLATLLAAGCVSVEEHNVRPETMASKGHASAWESVNHAVAVIRPTAGNQCTGVVHFYQQGDTLKIVADLSGLTPNQKHGFHIHELGDVSAPDGTATGGHYNPENHEHALPVTAMRHAGDLGNLQADADGKAHLEITVANLTIAGLRNPVIGRGVIVHAKADDGGQPTGNAGGRIGQGVIGLAKSTG